MRAVLKYPGAKNRIANWICGYIPEHKVYLEPYAGSLAVLFNKQRSHIETVNDLNKDVVNFFRVLRDHPYELKRVIELTPFARSEYESSYEETTEPIEKARRFYVKCWQGFGCSSLYKNGFKSGQQSNSPNPAKAWAETPDIIMMATERLRGVQIENLPALELIDRYDTKDVFMYVDPPYLHDTRKNYLYKNEMEDKDHVELLEVLLKHPGRIILSGYDNELYNSMLSGWRKESISTQAENGLKRVETLWMNYRDNQMSIEDFPEVMP